MKPTLKLQVIEKREKLTKQEVKEKSRKIIDNLRSLKEFQSAKNILFYVSFNKEVNTQELIKELLGKKEKTVVVPYLIKNYPILQLSELKNFDELEEKSFGIMEPREFYIREFSIDRLDLVILPGIVFDKEGYRIGFGHGYYDRFLKKLKKNVKKIGLAFEVQIVDNIPEEKHDVPVDVVVTEKGVIRCNDK